MKSYEIWKENVHISDVYNAIKKNWEWNVTDGCSFPEAVEIGEISEKALKNLKVLNATEIATIKVREYFNRDNIDYDEVSLNELYYVRSRKFEVYSIWDWKEEKVSVASDINDKYLPFSIYFRSKESCENAIKAIGERDLKEYYFDIKDNQ